MGYTDDVEVMFELDWGEMNKGGYVKLEKIIQEEIYTLIIIDTLTKAFPDLPHTDHAEILVRWIDKFYELTRTYNANILFNDHHRKPFGKYVDPIDDILGDSGKAKSLDTSLALYREQGKKGAMFVGRGREYEDFDMHLMFDPHTYCWQLESSETYSPVKDEIEEYLKTHPRCKASEAGKALNIENISNVRTRFNKLVEEGKAIPETTPDGTKLYTHIDNMPINDTPYWAMNNKNSSTQTSFINEQK